MVTYFWVALGGALGTMARHWASGFVAKHFGETLPWGTLLVNVTGSLAIGFFATATAAEGRWLTASDFRVFFMAGLCGGYTTFSAFSLQTLNLARDGAWFRAGVNSVASFVFCLLAVWLGHVIATTVNSWKTS
jgi:CrcB protein